MSYSIKENNSGNLILQRKGATGKVILFVSVSLIFFSIGALLHSFGSGNDKVPLDQFGLLFMLFGCVGIYSGLNIPSQQKKTVPEQIVFENEKGYVKILQSAESSQCSYIRYEEIEDFYIHVKVEKSMNSNTTRSTKTVYYGVRIRKKDRGEWEVFNSTSENKSAEILNTLKENVKLRASSSSIPKPILTDKVSKDVKGQKVAIRWKNKGVAGLLMLLGFASIFSYIFYFIFSMIAGSGGVFFYFVMSFIALIFLFVIGWNMRKMIRNIMRVYGFSISSQQFEYFEEDHSGMMQRSVVIPIKEINAVSFTFTPSDASSQISSLYVFTSGDVAKYDSIKSSRSPLSIIKDSISLYTNQVQLDLSSLNAVEKLELERWLQDTIKEKARVEVL